MNAWQYPEQVIERGRFMAVEIDVTSWDIDRGWVGDCNRCPLALAILRVLAQRQPPLARADPVKVYGDHVQVQYLDGSAALAVLDIPQRHFVHAFDHGRASDVKPFGFNLVLRPWQSQGWEGE